MSADNGSEFDVALSESAAAPGSSTVTLRINLPVALSRPLIAKGYTRARVTVTDNGILLQPYVAPRRQRGAPSVALPDWNAT